MVRKDEGGVGRKVKITAFRPTKTSVPLRPVTTAVREDANQPSIQRVGAGVTSYTPFCFVQQRELNYEWLQQECLHVIRVKKKSHWHWSIMAAGNKTQVNCDAASEAKQFMY